MCAVFEMSNMNKKLFLGIDIGTTSLKAAVFDENGQRVGVRAVDYTLDTDGKTGYIEFDAENYIKMCKTVIAELEAECGEISALSIDTQGETLILTDEQGTPLHPAVVWLDNRAVDARVFPAHLSVSASRLACQLTKRLSRRTLPQAPQ